MSLLQKALDQLAENVKQAADEAMAGGKYGLALQNVAAASLTAKGGFNTFTYNFAGGNPAAAPATLQQIIDISGTWMAVDRSSNGCPIGVFQKNNVDIDSVALAPGAVFKIPFNGFRFNSGNAWVGSPAYPVTASLPCSADLVQAGQTIAYGSPRLILHFGSGECPFTATANPYGSDTPTVLFNTTTISVAPGSVQPIYVPPGSCFDVSLQLGRATTGSTGLTAFVLFVDNTGPDLGAAWADSQAVLGTTAFLNWRNLRAPRTTNKAVLFPLDFGTGGAGNFTLNNLSVTCR